MQKAVLFHYKIKSRKRMCIFMLKLHPSAFDLIIQAETLELKKIVTSTFKS